jgi:hypothetical protein
MSAFQWSRCQWTSSRTLCVYALVRGKHTSVSPLPNASAARTSPCIALNGGTPVLAGEPANRPGRRGMLLRSMYPYRDGHIYRYVYTCPAEWGGAPWPADLGTWGGGRGRVATTLPRSRSQTRVVVVVTHPRLRGNGPSLPLDPSPCGLGFTTGGSPTAGAAIRL